MKKKDKALRIKISYKELMNMWQYWRQTVPQEKTKRRIEKKESVT